VVPRAPLHYRFMVSLGLWPLRPIVEACLSLERRVPLTPSNGQSITVSAASRRRVFSR